MLWVARGRRSRETRRAILTTTAVVLTVALSVTALYAAAVGVLYAQRIYPGVSALGMDLGGRTVGDASRLVSGRLDRYGGQRITVRAAGFQTTIAASDLGFRPRTAALVRASYQVGRASPLELGLLTEAVGGRTSPSLAPDWDVDPTAVDRAVAAIAARVDRSPVEPTIAIGPTATFQPGRDGQTLDRIGARVAIERYLAGLTSGPLDLPVAVGHPTVSDQQVRDLADLASAILAQPASVTDGGQTWAIPSDTVRAALSYTPSPPGLDLDPAKLSAALQPIAAPLNRPPHDAALVVAGGKVQVVPERAGQRVDLAASAAALRAGLLAGQHTVGLVVTTTSPRIHAADLSAVAAQARQWLARGLVLTADGQPYPVTGPRLGDLLIVVPSDSGPPTLSLDRTKLAAVIADVNREYERPAIATRFNWNGGQVSFLGPSRAGWVVDQNAAIKAVLAGWQTGRVALPVVQSPDALDAAYLARLRQDLKGPIADRATTYVGSIPERAHNVALAASRLNGVVVAPGALFSFNQAVGPTTLAAGFRWGFAFTKDPAGDSRTVPSVAGGLCQVASTVFQPVFWSGYEIDERHYHMFWIRHYEDRGYIGLDATVSPDDGVDFKFTNDTDHALLIQAWTDPDELIHVQLVGTRPDWKVEVSPETITDVIPAPTAVLRTTSPLFASGRVIDLEDAQTGLTSQVTRQVIYPDGQVRTLNLKSIYQPANAAVLVGTG